MRSVEGTDSPDMAIEMRSNSTQLERRKTIQFVSSVELKSVLP